MFSAGQSRVHLTWTWPCGHAGAEARITPVADSPHRKHGTATCCHADAAARRLSEALRGGDRCIPECGCRPLVRGAWRAGLLKHLGGVGPPGGLTIEILHERPSPRPKQGNQELCRGLATQCPLRRARRA